MAKVVPVPSSLVSLAVLTIRDFCKEKGVTMDVDTMIQVGVVFGRGLIGESHEWMPSKHPIHRILFEALVMHGHCTRFATVFGEEAGDADLTQELNVRITKATGGLWS